MAERIRSLRGFNDILPAETPLWRHFYDAVHGVMDAYGYAEIKLPILESTDLFKRSVGEVTDIVEKEMFTFVDREKSSISLRPEGTASCVRAGIENGLLHNQQQRLWYQGPMFRHERPQAGRYRQFHQVGVEAFGFSGADIDIEVIALSARLWKKIGLNDLTLEINSLGTPDCRSRFRQALVDFVSQHESQLDDDSKRRLESNPLRILDSKIEQTQAILANAPRLEDFLSEESAAHFAALKSGLDALGISYIVNPKLVRGLDYYTHTVFEWTTTRLGAQATVCAGGRYDGLVAQLGGGDTPGFGFALGVERLILLLQQDAANTQFTGPNFLPDAYMCVTDEKLWTRALFIAEQLRDHGIKLQLNAGGGSLKAQLKRADKSDAQYALILGEEESARDAVQVKSLRERGEAREVAIKQLVTELTAAIAGQSTNSI